MFSSEHEKLSFEYISTFLPISNSRLSENVSQSFLKDIDNHSTNCLLQALGISFFFFHFSRSALLTLSQDYFSVLATFLLSSAVNNLTLVFMKYISMKFSFYVLEKKESKSHVQGALVLLHCKCFKCMNEGFIKQNNILVLMTLTGLIDHVKK